MRSTVNMMIIIPNAQAVATPSQRRTYRRPFATSNECDSSIWIGRNDMVATHRRPGRRIGVAGERTVALPSTKHVAPPHLQVLGKILLCFVKEPLNLLLRRLRRGFGWAFSVSGTNNCESLPWQEKEEAAIRRINIQQSNSLG